MWRRLAGLIVLAGVMVLAVVVFRDGPGEGQAGVTPRNLASADLFPTEFHQVQVAPVKGPNVVLICIDTLRADHMSLYGYHRPTTPRIDEFSTRCRIYERAYASAPFTSPSVVSMLTGLYPYRHGVRLLWQQVEKSTITIADHLRRVGYQTAAVVSNLALSDQACGLGSRFEHYDDEVDEPEPHRPHMLERRAGRTTDAALEWLTRGRRGEQPFFLWVHYIDPHGPYRPPEDAPVEFTHRAPRPVDVTRVASYVREQDVSDGLDYVDRYDEEIAYTDREVGRLLDALAELGLVNESLIILTADHGEMLMDGPGQFFCHGFDVWEAVIHIPLLVCGKGVSGGRESKPVSITDVTPTVLTMVGLTVPHGLDGRSLLGGVSPRPPYAEGPDSGGSGGLHRAFVYADRKIIVQHGRSNVPRRAWAYDLRVDPAEQHALDVDTSEPAYVVLEGLIRSDPDPGGKPAKYAAGENPAPLVPDELDENTMRQLRSLGYVQ